MICLSANPVINEKERSAAHVLYCVVVSVVFSGEELHISNPLNNT